MKQRLIALALCLVITLGLAAPSFAVQADAPGGLDGSEPDLWEVLSPDAPGLPDHPHLFGVCLFGSGAVRRGEGLASDGKAAGKVPAFSPSEDHRIRPGPGERSPIQAGGEVKYDNDSSGDRLVPAQDLRVL